MVKIALNRAGMRSIVQKHLESGMLREVKREFLFYMQEDDAE